MVFSSSTVACSSSLRVSSSSLVACSSSLRVSTSSVAAWTSSFASSNSSFGVRSIVFVSVSSSFAASSSRLLRSSRADPVARPIQVLPQALAVQRRVVRGARVAVASRHGHDDGRDRSTLRATPRLEGELEDGRPLDIRRRIVQGQGDRGRSRRGSALSRPWRRSSDGSACARWTKSWPTAGAVDPQQPTRGRVEESDVVAVVDDHDAERQGQQHALGALHLGGPCSPGDRTRERGRPYLARASGVPRRPRRPPGCVPGGRRPARPLGGRSSVVGARG